jgi:serine/threonine-protein kinase
MVSKAVPNSLLIRPHRLNMATSPESKTSAALKLRQRLGKYRIDSRLGEGGFGAVYRAFDTIMGIHVALKIPHATLMTFELLEAFKREIRTTMQLEHDNILPIRDASMIDGRFVIVLPLGEGTLDERMGRRISFETIIDYTEQLLDAVAFAHNNRIIHCDIKPENIILFADHRIRLTDFGIAKVAQRTIRGAGTGTLGYMAPEQAMGRPSMRSDVFSIGLILCRLLSGQWPEWPFAWPPPGYSRLRNRAHPELIALIRKSIELNPRKRFADADRMLAAFTKLKLKALNHARRSRRS